MLPRRLTSVLALSGLVLVGAAAQEPPPYLIVAPDGSRALPVQRQTGTTDFVALDTLARLFDVAMREDARTGGVVLSIRSQRVVLTQGQATVSSGGRLVSLSAAVIKDGPTWLVPIDFLRVLDPLLNRRIEIRRRSRLVVLDAASVPRLTPRLERTATGGRLTLTIEPSTNARVTREGSLVTVRFQADALDLGPLDRGLTDLLAGIRTTGSSLLLDLGSSVTNVRQSDSQDSSRITLDLIASTTTSSPPRDLPAPTPALDRPNMIRTVVLDAGHGGPDVGSRSATGLEEKQVTLAVAQRLKVVLESRLGLRVILTRDADTEVPIDRRGALANNNKADLFISLHANGSPVAEKRGWQVQSLDPADYAGGGAAGPVVPTTQTVPVVGGGTRVIDTVIWRLAQLPHTDRSLSFANLLAARLADTGLPAQTMPVQQVPLRVLVGANMPAVVIELGFLTNDEDATVLLSGQFHESLAEVIASVISDLRGGWPEAGGDIR